MHTDISPEHLLFSKTPKSWHPYIRLARLDRPTGIWLLLLPCWWSLTLASGGVLNMDTRGWTSAILFLAGAVVMRAAGCVVNDLWDRRLDAEVERTKIRPLPAGDVSPAQAIRFLLALLGIAFGILLCFPAHTILLGAGSLPLIAVYPLMKRLTWWPQAFLGLTFNWGALMGFSALTGRLPAAAFFLYAGGVLWTIAYDTIYAHQDRADDEKTGILSTARLFGENSKTWVAWLLTGAFLCVLIAKYGAAPSIMTPLLTVLPAAYAWRIVRSWDMTDPASSLSAFRRNARLGLLVLLVLAL